MELLLFEIRNPDNVSRSRFAHKEVKGGIKQAPPWFCGSEYLYCSRDHMPKLHTCRSEVLSKVVIAGGWIQ